MAIMFNKNIQYCNFYKHTTMLVLKTEPKRFMRFDWIPLSTRQDNSYALCINGSNNIKQTTITLNQKNQPLHLLQRITTSVLKKELQIPCFLHECLWSPLSIPRMSKLTPVAWVAIFDVSLQIFGSVAHVVHHSNALFNMHSWKRLR